MARNSQGYGRTLMTVGGLPTLRFNASARVSHPIVKGPARAPRESPDGMVPVLRSAPARRRHGRPPALSCAHSLIPQTAETIRAASISRMASTSSVTSPVACSG